METITQSFIKKEFIVCLNSDIEETIQQISLFNRFNKHFSYSVLPLPVWSSAPSDLWESTGLEVASALRALGLPIGPVVTMETKKKGGPWEALKAIREADKVKGQC